MTGSVLGAIFLFNMEHLKTDYIAVHAVHCGEMGALAVSHEGGVLGCLII